MIIPVYHLEVPDWHLKMRAFIQRYNERIASAPCLNVMMKRHKIWLRK